MVWVLLLILPIYFTHSFVVATSMLSWVKAYTFHPYVCSWFSLTINWRVDLQPSIVEIIVSFMWYFKLYVSTCLIDIMVEMANVHALYLIHCFNNTWFLHAIWGDNILAMWSTLECIDVTNMHRERLCVGMHCNVYFFCHVCMLICMNSIGWVWERERYLACI